MTTPPETPTPLTDAMATRVFAYREGEFVVDADFARELERLLMDVLEHRYELHPNRPLRACMETHIRAGLERIEKEFMK